MLTSTSEVLTPAELSMASVLSRTPRSAASMRPRWVMPRLAPSPITLQRSSRAGDADRVVGAVADRVVGLGRGAHIGADAAEEEQVDRRLQDRVHQLGRRRLRPWRSRAPPAPPATARSPSASAGRRRRPPRSAPCRSPASSSAAGRTAAARSAKLVAGSGSGSMKMSRWSKAATSLMVVARSMPLPNTSPDMSPTPTTVNGVVPDVDVHLAEMALHRLPGAARGDAHLLVVVAGRAAGGEGVVEPEAVLRPRSRWRCRRRSPCPCRRRPRDRDRRRRGARRCRAAITPSSSRLSVMSSSVEMNSL